MSKLWQAGRGRSSSGEKEKLRCVECGCELEEGTKFCPNCGKPIETETFDEEKEELRCAGCGYELEEGAKFAPTVVSQ